MGSRPAHVKRALNFFFGSRLSNADISTVRALRVSPASEGVSRSLEGSFSSAEYHKPDHVFRPALGVARHGLSSFSSSLSPLDVQRASFGTSNDDAGSESRNTTESERFAPNQEHKYAESQVLELLGLGEKTQEEVSTLFRQADHDGDGNLSAGELRALLLGRTPVDLPHSERAAVVEAFLARLPTPPSDGSQVPLDDLDRAAARLASHVDRRVWPVALCQGLSGLSLGMIVPLLPQLVGVLGLSVQDYGFATSVYGATRMMGNYPAAALCELGRVPVLSTSLGLIGASFAGLTAIKGAMGLVACRAVAGFGMSGSMTSSTAYAVDVSNVLNRARTVAPVTGAFAAGATVGPMVAGYLSSVTTMNGTFLASAAVLCAAAGASRLGIPETARRTAAPTASMGQTDWQKWAAIMREPGVPAVVGLTAIFNMIYSGAQITLLPMMLTQNLGWGVAGIGMMFSGMNFINAGGAPAVGRIADRIGPQILLGPACLGIAGALAVLPQAQDLSLLVPAAGVWALGNTVMMTLPQTFISSAVRPEMRVQAIALLRTAGDLGFLFGGACTGSLAAATSLGTALAGTGALIGAAGGLFTAKMMLPVAARRSKSS